ncbi:MAG: response regulator, partial [Clostridia bacterium]|nr:response regulator [Clostridia bacterium]
MYNIIIVDDEISTHELMKDYIETVIGGFNVTGCLKNGAEAIDFLKSNYVDIVITDIKMPKVSGLELAKFIYENMPHIKVIIVSGYGEFEYARQAMAYNVSNYLLKAIDMRELTEVLKKLSREIDEDKRSNADVDNTVQREVFCTDIIAGALERNEIAEEYEKCNIPYELNNVKIAVFKCNMTNYMKQMNERWNYDAEYFYDAIKGVLQSVINEYSRGIVIEISKQSQSLIIAVMTDCAIFGIEKKFEEGLKDIMGLNCEISMIMDFCGLYEIGDGVEVFDKNELYKIMISYIKMYGTKRAKRVTEHVMKLMNNENPQGKKLNVIDKNGEVSDEAIYTEIGGRQQKEEIIKNAKKYIDENYMNDISYTDVADALYFNGVYFSRFFKQQTGMTIGEYLLEIRMQKAI